MADKHILRANISDCDDSSDGIFYWIHGTPVTYTSFAMGMVMIMTHIGSIAFNSLMIAAIRRSRKIDQPSGHCLIALSAAYMWAALNMMYNGTCWLINLQNDKNECLIRAGFLHSCFIIVTWTKCTLVTDRYLQIEFPFWYIKHVHKHRIWIAYVSGMVCGIFYGQTMWMFGWYVPLEGSTRGSFCENFSFVPTLHRQLLYLITILGFLYTVSVYTRLLWIANREKGSLRKFKGSKASKGLNAEKTKKINWKPVKLVLALALVCCAGWATPGVFDLVLTFHPQQYAMMAQKYQVLIGCLHILTSMAGIVNACLYTLHREVKLRFLQLIGCQRFVKTKRMPAYIIPVRNIVSNTKTRYLSGLQLNHQATTSDGSSLTLSTNDSDSHNHQEYKSLTYEQTINTELSSSVANDNHRRLSIKLSVEEESRIVE